LQRVVGRCCRCFSLTTFSSCDLSSQESRDHSGRTAAGLADFGPRYSMPSSPGRESKHLYENRWAPRRHERLVLEDGAGFGYVGVELVDYLTVALFDHAAF
jgi:hypothetical protein